MNKSFKNIPETSLGWQPREGELFDVFKSYQKIGSCALTLVENQEFPRTGACILPNSWFQDRNSNWVVPVLEITGLETFQQRCSGNGRLCLQALYDLSCRRGCGGRMQVFADFDSAEFYEHCGFKGQNAGQNGFKYFDPTSENLHRLFPEGFQQNEFRFIPVPLPCIAKNTYSHTDKVLFDRMLQKVKS